MLVNHDKIRLILASLLMLFTELMLIRWIGSNIFFLSFFTNFVLLASFLGIGIAFIRPKQSPSLFPFAPIVLTLLILVCYYFRFQYAIRIDPNTDDILYSLTYFKENFFPIEITLPIIFILVTISMLTIADGVKNEFQKFANLQAYRLEIIGALLGVILFSYLAFLHSTPIIWGGIISILLIFLLKKDWHFLHLLTYLQIFFIILMLFALGKESLNPAQIWSSYYKITMQPYSHDRLAISVNGVLQQFIESVEQRKKYKPFYFLPYQHMSLEKKLDNVLVIGAGTGGDVAIALSQGAKHIDAVEIDSGLYQLGKKLNPDRPYLDPRVNIIIDDGRSYLQKNKKRYDMIIFALPDSIMLIPGQASLRLENYLFTIEGIQQVYQHLKKDGVFTMYSYYHSRWLVDRLANTITTVFQHPPCHDNFGANQFWLAVFTISPTTSNLQCPALWNNQFIEFSKPATDNHPFVFLTKNSISFTYLVTLFFILIVAFFGIKFAGGKYLAIFNYADLFLMGAAFLLLETKSIVSFALFFGTTWLVNALVFTGILFTVYLAIECSHRKFTFPNWLLHILLLFSLFILWLMPNEFLLSQPLIWRAIIAIAMTFTPIFLANLIFAERFKQTIDSTQAFGANLMGAVVGGLLEYSSLIIGYRNLIILIVALYIFALLARSTLYRSHYALT